MKTATILRAYEFGYANGFNRLNSPNPYSGRDEPKLRRAWAAGQHDGHVRRRAIDELQALQAQPEPVKDIPMNERQRTFEWP